MKFKMPKEGIALLNNYRPAVIALFFCLFAKSVDSQVLQKPTIYGKIENILSVDSTLWLPSFCGTPTRLRSIDVKKAAVIFDSCSHRLFVYDPKTKVWDSVHLGISGSGVGVTLQQVKDLIRDSLNSINTAIVNGDETKFKLVTVPDDPLNDSDVVVKSMEAGFGTKLDSTSKQIKVSADTSQLTTLNRLLKDSAFLKALIDLKVEASKRSNDSVYAKINGVWVFQYKDSAGAPAYIPNFPLSVSAGHLIADTSRKDSSLVTNAQLVENGIDFDPIGKANGAFIAKRSPGVYEEFTDLFGTMKGGIIGVDDNFPVSGDTLISNTNWINKTPEIFLNGIRLQEGVNYNYNYSTGTIDLNDTLRYGYPLLIKVTPYALNYDIAAQPGGGWIDMDYPISGNLTSTSHIWTTTTASSSWGGVGLGANTFTGDGQYIVQYNSTDGYNVILGLNTANLGQPYGNYLFGAYIQPSGDVTNVIAGTPTTVVGTVTNGQWVRLNISGTTVNISKSSDKSTWTNLHTFSTARPVGNLYPNINIYSGTIIGQYKAPHPQYK